MPQTPTSRPNPDQKLWVSRLLTSTFLTQKQIDAEFAAGRPIVAAARGLFANSIGAPGDDINEYDDGIAILFPDGRVLTFNGNTQPTRYGYNAHAGDNMACLVPGAYWMVSRQHGASRPGGGYPAFGQEDRPVTIDRINSVGKATKRVTGCFGIDLHPGGANSVSSEGCQTIYPPQWKEVLVALPKRVYFRYVMFDVKDLPENLR